jgi:hypothetical protein
VTRVSNTGKLAGGDKKLSASIEQEVVSGLAASPASLSSSPVGPLSDASSRKTLIYLILTLNHCFPDYDFSTLRSHHFTKEDGLRRARDTVEGLLLEPARLFGAAQAPVLETLWARLEEVIQPVECDVYSYKADTDGDPFNEAASLWSINFFFFNRRLKRIVCFTAMAVTKSAFDRDGDGGEPGGDGDLDFDMDE